MNSDPGKKSGAKPSSEGSKKRPPFRRKHHGKKSLERVGAAFESPNREAAEIILADPFRYRGTFSWTWAKLFTANHPAPASPPKKSNKKGQGELF